MSEPTKELRPVITYPRDAILEASHVAAALGVSEEVVGKMDLPYVLAGKRVRYFWCDVYDALRQRQNGAAVRPRLSA